MTLQEIKQRYSKQVDLKEVDLLISFALKKTLEFILLYSEFELTKKQEERISSLIRRRKKGEPLAYIIGEKEFFGLDFFVNKNVLIPRLETELILEEILGELGNGNEKTTVLDVGCGSGNIIISLSKNLIRQSGQNVKNIKFLASDISKQALSIAVKNAKLHKQENKIKFYLSDLLKNKELEKELTRSEKIIIAANLPYVPNHHLKKEPTKETLGLKYEPKLALLGGQDGLDIYKKLIKQTLKIRDNFPKLKIMSFYEIEAGQNKLIEKWKKENSLEMQTSYSKDLSKKWRLSKIEF